MTKAAAAAEGNTDIDIDGTRTYFFMTSKMTEINWDERGLKAKRRKEIRKLHFDLEGYNGDVPNDETNFHGFHIRSGPQPFTIGAATEPGLTRLRAYSKRNIVGWRQYSTMSEHASIGLERKYPFNIFALDICPANHNNMVIQIIGDCLPNETGDPPQNPDCKYWLKTVTLDADKPTTVHLNPAYYRNLRTFIVRESPILGDKAKKILHPDAEPDAPPIIGVTNIICKLTQEKYLDYPDTKGSFPN